MAGKSEAFVIGRVFDAPRDVVWNEAQQGRTKITVQWLPHSATEIERKTFSD